LDVKTFYCEKYKERIDINKRPCPHPNDYCPYRTRCIVNMVHKEKHCCAAKEEEKGENA